MTTPSPSPARKAIVKEAEKQYTISNILKWTAVGISAALGLAALAVALLLKSSTTRKVSVVVMLALVIGLAWAAWGIHRAYAQKTTKAKWESELKKAGIDVNALGVDIQVPKFD